MSTIINDEYCSRDLPTDFQLLPCAICGRTFQPLSLGKHYAACERNASIKRPVFDSMKKRLEGTELELYNKYSYSSSYSPNPIRKRFANSHANGSSAISPSSPNNSYESRLFRSNSVSRPLGKNEHCPYCERQFGPKAFDDHVKWCKEHYFFNRNQKKNVDSSLKEAKERLDARIKYRVPPVQKSKRTLVKEKYSTPPPCPLKRTESVHDLTAEKGESNNDVFFKRTTSLRKPKMTTSLNYYAPKSPSIPLDYYDSQTNFSSTCSSVSSKQCSEYDCSPFQSAERQFMELLQCDDFKIFSEEKNAHKSTDATKQSKSSNVSEQNTTASYDLTANIKTPPTPTPTPTPTSKSLTGSSLTLSSLAALETHENGPSNISTHNWENKKTTDQNIDNDDFFSVSPSSPLSSIDNNTSPKSPNDVSQPNNKNVIKKFLTFNSRNNLENRHIFAGAKNSKSETDSEQQINCTKPKYCHECGTKYPIESAKFCVECGVKRLIV